MTSNKRKKLHPSDILIRVVMIVYAVIAIYPVLWTISCSLKTNADLFNNIFALPTELHWENYVNAWQKANISQYFFNTVWITALSLVGVLAIASMTAYVLACYSFKGKKLATFLYISGIMIPGVAGIIPLFLELNILDLLDNRMALVFVQIANMLPFSVFLLITFFRGVPHELKEAAILDGCNHYNLFWRIMLPQAKPGLLSVLIIQFMNCWNEFYFSLILLMTDSNRTLQFGLYALKKVTNQRADWVVMFAAAVIVMLPCIIVYIIFQRRIVEGVNAGAIKG